MISNPDCFGTFRRYFGFLTNLFGRNEVESLKLDRLDVRVDLELDLQDIKRWIRVRGKQATRADIDRSGIRTGIYFGKRPSFLCAYDKKKQLEKKGLTIDGPLTRLEWRFYHGALPVTYVRELPEILGRNSNGELFRPYKNVSMEPIHLRPLENFTALPLDTNRKVTRLIDRIRLETCLEVGGYDVAYREMNKHGNYRRDIGHLAYFEEFPHDFDQVLIAELERFFERTASTEAGL